MNRIWTAVFLVLGLIRVHDFSRSGEARDILAGAGFLLLAYSSYRDALPGSRSVPGAAKPADRVARYGGFAGFALVATALVMRLAP